MNKTSKKSLIILGLFLLAVPLFAEPVGNLEGIIPDEIPEWLIPDWLEILIDWIGGILNPGIKPIPIPPWSPDQPLDPVPLGSQ